MAGHDIIVIGASAGGVRAIREVIRMLPRDIEAAIFVAMHLSAERQSNLAALLASSGQLPATFAVDREPFAPGRIYVAPPDRHLIVERTHIRVVRGPKENRFRPSVDVLFRSAALAYGPRVVGVVLTGMLSDGAAGLAAVKSRGGIAIVQEPRSAQFCRCRGRPCKRSRSTQAPLSSRSGRCSCGSPARRRPRKESFPCLSI